MASTAHGFQPASNGALKTAVSDWCTNAAAAKAKYDGQDINEWDVSKVTSMEQLFYSKSSCDVDDIDNWDTSQDDYAIHV